MTKLTFISHLSLLIPAKFLEEVNKLLKYFKKTNKPPQKKSYVQASSQSKQAKSNTSLSIAMDILKIKETFPNLSNKKINLVQKVINSNNGKPKPKINMMMKGPSHKQIIIPMNGDLVKRFIKDSSIHIININCAFKNILSNMITNFIQADNKGIIIATNNVLSPLDLQEIKRYVKSSLTSDAEQISSSRLPQSKFYLKIVGIPYISKRLNSCLSLNEIKSIFKNNHVFNNIILTSKS